MKRYRRFTIMLLIAIMLLQSIMGIRVYAALETITKSDDNSVKLTNTVDYDSIGKQIEDYVEKNKDATAGMSVSVFDDKNVLYTGGFGYSDMANKVSVDSSTVMDWGSVTKILTWVSVMQLEEQGKINLESDIRNYLPENFLHNLKFEKPVTMLNLMNNDAGFEENFMGMFTNDETKIISLEEYLRNHQPAQIYEPGTVCAGTNWSTTLAGYIVQRVSGNDYAQYVKENIFEPLGMKNASICADLSDNQTVKEKRKELKTYRSNLKEIMPNVTYINISPAGGCVSTIGDLTTFARELLNENTKLFKNPSTYKKLFTPSSYYGDSGVVRNYHGMWASTKYALRVVGRDGNTAGCSSNLLIDLDNCVGIVIQTNVSQESKYIKGLPDFLFMQYESNNANDTYRVFNPKTYQTGLLKILRLSSITTFKSKEFYTKVNMGGVEKIEQKGSDCLIVDTKDFLVDYVTLGLYVAVMAFGIISAFVGFVKNKILKKGKKALAGWATGALVLTYIPVIIMEVLLRYQPNVANLWSTATFQAISGAIFVVTLGMAVMFVLGLVKLLKTPKMSLLKSRVAYLVLVELSIVIAVFNSIYWNWCMFWLK